jgi:hypothetical protein
MKAAARTLANWQRVYAMSFSSVYPIYVKKAEKKSRTKADVDAAIRWLTGYTQKSLEDHIKKKTSFEDFFAKARRTADAEHPLSGQVGRRDREGKGDG